MSQSDSSSQSISKTLHPTAKIIKRRMEMWNAFRLTHPFHREGEGFRFVLNLADTPYRIGKQNLASWNSENGQSMQMRKQKLTGVEALLKEGERVKQQHNDRLHQLGMKSIHIAGTDKTAMM